MITHTFIIPDPLNRTFVLLDQLTNLIVADLLRFVRADRVLPHDDLDGIHDVKRAVALVFPAEEVVSQRYDGEGGGCGGRGEGIVGFGDCEGHAKGYEADHEPGGV
jgi:hypothetical protein